MESASAAAAGNAAGMDMTSPTSGSLTMASAGASASGGTLQLPPPASALSLLLPPPLPPPGRRLAGTVVLVTGGATGIGAACALAFAREGADVAIAYSRSASEASSVVAACAAAGVRALALRADCAVDAEVRALLAAVAAALGGVDTLVVSAGRTRFIELADLDAVSEADLDGIFALNFKGAFYAARAAAPLMRLRPRGGLIVNIASLAGMTGAGSSLPYAASKGALITLSKSLARALAPHIRVNAVAPGIVSTRWVAGREAFVAKHAEGTPMGRAATAEDVAGVVLAFATSATFLTGEVVAVDGGREMRG